MSRRMVRCTLRKYKAFEQRIARQSIASMHAVAAGLADRIQAVHRCLAVQIDLDAAHEIVLPRCNRNRLLCHVVAFLETLLVNVWETLFDKIWVEMRNRKLDIRAIVNFHLLADFLCEQIARQQFIDKALALCIEQISALAAH